MPWHTAQFSANKCLPCASVATVNSGSDGILLGGLTGSFFQRSENVLMDWITAIRSSEGMSYLGGMGVPQRPCVTVMNKSSAVGKVLMPPEVERNLKMPLVKSRGVTLKNLAPGPLPSPCSP